MTTKLPGNQPFKGGYPLRTVARGANARKNSMIASGLLAACVINGESLTGVLDHATEFLWTVIILIIVQAFAGWINRCFV